MTPAETPLAPYGGRRFVLAICGGAVYTVLLVAGIVTEDAYIWLQGITVGAYMGASAVQHANREKYGVQPQA
jgi:hypothetical protein